MKAYQSDTSQFEKANTAVLGISTDSAAANKAFAGFNKLTFPILSDPSGRVAREYGVLDAKSGLANRTTFVIDRHGIIRHVDVNTAALSPMGAAGACNVLEHEKQMHAKR